MTQHRTYRTYRCTIEIDVDATSHREAAQLARRLLIEGAGPIVEVRSDDDVVREIDLTLIKQVAAQEK